MELNRTKRGIELGAAIIAVVYCLIDLVLEIFAFGELIDLIDYLKSIDAENYYLYMQSTIIGYIIGFILGVALVVIELIFACLLIKLPINSRNSFIDNEEYYKNELRKRKRIRVCFIVFTSILAFFMLINCFQTSEIGVSGTSIIGLLIFATIIVLESIAMPMKDFNEESQAKKVGATANLNIEQKINELKHLKDLGVIDEEQYRNAVEKNIKDIM